MIRKTALGIAAAAVVSAAALTGTASTAQAGSFGFGFHGGHGSFYIGSGHGFHGHYGNPCRHWKRKWRRTGRYRFLRRYRRCMARHYY
ncbi:MAG: hypothetical protein AAF441_17755 [Pseudomonadota bacterium]